METSELVKKGEYSGTVNRLGTVTKLRKQIEGMKLQQKVQENHKREEHVFWRGRSLLEEAKNKHFDEPKKKYPDSV